jgi:hypothetical protein
MGEFPRALSYCQPEAENFAWNVARAIIGASIKGSRNERKDFGNSTKASCYRGIPDAPVGHGLVGSTDRSLN